MVAGGRLIYALAWHDDGLTSLVRINSETGSIATLIKDLASLMHPQVSPDGRWIACTRMAQLKEIRRLKL